MTNEQTPATSDRPFPWRPPTPLDWDDEFSRAPTTLEWIVEPFLPVKRHITLAGPAKAGKSLFVAEMAACIASGRSFLGFPVNRSSVAYLDFESNAKPACRITLDYFDEGDAEVTIVYDSTDPKVKVVPRTPGAWKRGIRFRLTNTRTWKQATFDINDARFAHRQNGRDIRVQVQGDKELIFGGLTIQALEQE